jgi:hypothetical protein
VAALPSRPGEVAGLPVVAETGWGELARLVEGRHSRLLGGAQEPG